jgi:hypothetical protein
MCSASLLRSHIKKLNSVVLVRKQTIPTERPSICNMNDEPGGGEPSKSCFQHARGNVLQFAKLISVPSSWSKQSGMKRFTTSE